MSSSNSNPRSAEEASPARRIAVDDGGLRLFPRAFSSDSPALFAALMAKVAWRQHELRLFGRLVRAPRLSAWYGDPGCVYRYSGLRLAPEPFDAVLLGMRERLRRLTGHDFNSVLLNLYRDGNDGMGWHSDDEPELGPAPLIASVSLGAPRRFLLRHRRRSCAPIELDLCDGDLLLMEPPLQRHWRHSVPKTKRPVGPRINLTWRAIIPARAGC